MRIVAGQYKGRLIEAPKKAITRPTTDRAREGIFNVLNSMGGIEGLSAVDLFAGSGSLGIESLSRGCATVTFVDHDADAISTVEANLKKIGANNAKLKKSDVLNFAKRMEPADIAFVDPPFALSDVDWQEILSALKAQLIVAESNRDISELMPASHPVVKVRNYGDSVVVFAGAERTDEIKTDELEVEE